MEDDDGSKVLNVNVDILGLPTMVLADAKRNSIEPVSLADVSILLRV